MLTTDQRLDAILVSLHAMNDTLGIQTEMLTKLLKAAEDDGSSNVLGKTLVTIATSLAQQTEALEGIAQRLDALPNEIAEAVA